MAPNAKVDISFAPTTAKDISLREKLGFLLVYAKLTVVLPFIVVRSLLSKSKSGKSWVFDLRSRILFFLLARVHPRQINLISPPTVVRIRDVSKKLNVTVTVDEVAHGAKIHWWGEKKGRNVLVHIHGGGYNLGIGEHHLVWLHRVQQALKKRGVEVDLAIMEYGLTPVARYPTQLIQSVEVLRSLIEKHGYDPANIILSGDSAGGGLILGVVSHILHPHPDIAPLSLPESSPKLGGLMAISPWTCFSTNFPSVQKLSGRDVVFPQFIEIWSRWLVDRPDEPRHKDLPPTDKKYTWDEYNQPNQAAPSWWTGLPAKKSIILIGDDETLRDSIVEFGQKFREGVEKDSAAAGSVEIVLCEGEIHTECLYDTFIPGEPTVPGKMAEAVWSFCEGVLKGN
ncbi:hypothetical protein ABW20_dc0101621 [Dactylellina cionopaga]|nr:hypothetical protein ABW20_dc0101621 [Dactylellina cionopaga]